MVYLTPLSKLSLDFNVIIILTTGKWENPSQWRFWSIYLWSLCQNKKVLEPKWKSPLYIFCCYCHTLLSLHTKTSPGYCHVHVWACMCLHLRVHGYFFFFFFTWFHNVFLKTCHLKVWMNEHVDTRMTIHFGPELKWTPELDVYTYFVSEKGQMSVLPV